MPTTGQPIDLSYARQLAKNFRDNQLASGKIRTDDTQAVWFSKQVLLNALSGDDVTGLRFYFGSYETKPGFPENPFDQNKLTLIAVQTGKDSIQIERGSVVETAFLDVITDPSEKPAYPSSPGPAAKNTYNNEGQCSPPPMPSSRLGLLDF